MSPRSEHRRLRFEQLESKFTLSSLLQTFATDAPGDAGREFIIEYETATAEDSYSTSVHAADVLRFVHANTYEVQAASWNTPSAEACQQADEMLAMTPHQLRDLF